MDQDNDVVRKGRFSESESEETPKVEKRSMSFDEWVVLDSDPEEEKDGGSDSPSHRPTLKANRTTSGSKPEKKPSMTAKLDCSHAKSKSNVASLKPPSDHQRRRNSLPLAIREWFSNTEGGGKSPEVKRTPPEVRDFARAELELEMKQPVEISAPLEITRCMDMFNANGLMYHAEALNAISRDGSTRVRRQVQDDSSTKSQNRLSNIFSNTFGAKPAVLDSQEKEKLELLYERLQQYSSEGLPDMPEMLMIGQPKLDESLYEIEEHWSNLVQDSESLDKRERNQQEAIWELLKTEVVYIQAIKVVIDVFLCCLINLQNDALLNEIDTTKLFSNIMEILNVNCRFWEDHLVRVVEESRRTGDMLQPGLLHDGFVRFNDDFQPYIRYCLDQEPAIQYLRDQYRDNELFKIFVNWAETQKQCKRLRLSDLLVKPMQRLTKYSLLLNAIRKKTECEEENILLEEMITNMDRFVMYVNSSLRQRQEKERLQEIQERIESYDVVDILNEESSKILVEYCQLDLMCPMPGCHPQQIRHLLCEGGLKFKDGIARSLDVYCFLFTDMLLITKVKRSDKVKVIKPPIRIDQTVIHELKDGGFLVLVVNEYRVAISAYTFQGEQYKLWVEKIRKAQLLYREHLDQAQNGTHEIILFEDLMEDDGLAFPSTASLNVPMQLKPSVSHEDLHRGSDSEVMNISRAKSTECLFMRADEKKSDFQAKSQVFNKTVSDSDSLSGDSFERSEIQLQVPRRGSGPNYLLVPSGSKVVQRTSLVNRSISVPASKVKGGIDSPPVDVSSPEEPRKLNQRRLLRSERRYHTADSAFDFEKDPSIHKRLSWNLGNQEHQNSPGSKHRSGSQDSIRSTVSSSGCSSLASLQQENSDTDESTIIADFDSNQTLDLPLGKPIQLTITLPDRHRERPLSASGLQPPSLSLESPDTKAAKAMAHDSKCRSLSDLSIAHDDQGQGQKEGMSTVTFQVKDMRGSGERLSPTQLLKLKKQLLLNSEVEASRVYQV